MRIDIWSDMVCPWCYLGAARFSAALDIVGREDVEVHWRAYQLDPSAPAEPRDLRTVIDGRYGPGSFDGMTQRLVALGAAEGLEYRFDRARFVNTADSHRLVAWAADEGDADDQARLVQVLFRSYFTDGADLSSHEALLAAVAEAGLDVDAAAAVLDSERYAAEVSEDQRLARERGITGVPAFVIDDTFLIPGAQEVDHIVSMLERARGKSATAG
ncbi:MAG: DsbA family oxidoreductase [Actinomycetota bacterium]|nr:DsbA family oxidoreductase [Actinomycetota bacterium]